MINILQNPLYNSIFTGILIYILINILINISNNGDPILGAILSSLPVGVLSLLAIVKKNNTQEFYIKSEIITNTIIIVMWISINILIYYFKDTNTVAIIGIIIWTILSIIFYFVAKNLVPNDFFLN